MQKLLKSPDDLGEGFEINCQYLLAGNTSTVCPECPGMQAVISRVLLPAVPCRTKGDTQQLSSLKALSITALAMSASRG